jgi:serine phosphatase RsbU (regulator of sigma subunit)
MKIVTPAPVSSSPFELIVRTPDGKSRVVPLDDASVSLGRAGTNDLCYPDDVGLSRQHMVFEARDGVWAVRDLNSKNGTFVQGIRINNVQALRPGDRISAGHLNIEFAAVSAGPAPPSSTVVFVDNDVVAAATTTVATSLEGMMGPDKEDSAKTRIFTGNPQVRALIRAGQELVGNLKLSELFHVIMDLSLEAVGAGRGVLMTVEDDELEVRAARGQGFQISSLVRDSVIREGKSMLVLDAQTDTAFRQRQSIVAQNVRSMLAVPLQTRERVIGLIYLDSPNMIRPFSRDDLNLLTVMANVAAIRIEHARLAEVEQAERMLAKDLSQAATIQRGLLPATAPKVDGFDIAGDTSPCRTVGGDYYDFIPFPDGRVGLLVGDVAGKGMPAALMMSSLQARVQVLFETPDDLSQKVARLNKAVASNCPDNRFITFFICVLDPATGNVIYTNAGHNPPLIVRQDGSVERLTEGGIILGIMPRFAYQQGSAVLEHGDVLVMYSDGVSEAMPVDEDEEFGEERLAAVVRSSMSTSSAEVVQDILRSVTAFTRGAPPADDITVLVARRK